jgi:tRNA splicing ligase
MGETMADQTNDAPKPKTAAENILNKIADLVPAARAHLGNDFKKIHDEITKLLPVGAAALGDLQNDLTTTKGLLDKAKAAYDELVEQTTAEVKALEEQVADLKEKLKTAQILTTTTATPPVDPPVEDAPVESGAPAEPPQG